MVVACAAQLFAVTWNKGVVTSAEGIIGSAPGSKSPFFSPISLCNDAENIMLQMLLMQPR